MNAFAACRLPFAVCGLPLAARRLTPPHCRIILTFSPMTFPAHLIKAVIFDMDGVLIDSEHLWKKAENEVFTSLGVELTEELCELTKSMTTSEVTSYWYSKYPWTGAELHEVEEMVVQRVIELMQSEPCDIRGVKPLLENLNAQQYKLGLATNSPARIIPIVLEKLGVSHLFDTTSSAEDESKGKPDPAVYITTARKLQVEPQYCLVIEDTRSGMQAAKAAGMMVAAFTNGNTELSFDIADYSIACFEEVMI